MAVRKFTLAVLGLLIAGGIAAYAGRNAIAERLYERALDQSVGVDQSLKLGDGLHAYLCGSGSPKPTGRPAPQSPMTRAA